MISVKRKFARISTVSVLVGGAFAASLFLAPTAQAAGPDFSNVKSGVTTTEKFTNAIDVHAMCSGL